MDKIALTSSLIQERSYVSLIKREIHNKVLHAGFNHVRVGEVDIIVSELTSNLIKFADKGEILYRISGTPNTYVEIFCIDNGPGHDDMQRMMTDGSSSANTLGHGLGAIERLSDIFQIYSMPEWGTVCYSRVYMNKQETHFRKILNEMQVGIIQVPIPNENICGDGYYTRTDENNTLFFLGDGLGHGIHAHNAVSTAIDAIKECNEILPSEILRYVHSAVKKTRGLVATVAVLNHANKEWRVCGIGNILTQMYRGIESKNYMSYNGILGHNIPKTLNDYTSDGAFQTIIMCSDGIKGKWSPVNYPSILKYHPSVIASVIFKDFARRTDDMSIMVAKVF
jgi:anti-sigma regulatory factor (Ser/Thr protein kinase)